MIFLIDNYIIKRLNKIVLLLKSNIVKMIYKLI